MFDFLKKLFKKSEVVESKESTELSDKVEDAAVEEKKVEECEQLEITEIVEEPQVEVSQPVAPKTVSSNKGKVLINNGVDRKFINKDDPIPKGWTLGGIKKVEPKKKVVKKVK